MGAMTMVFVAAALPVAYSLFHYQHTHSPRAHLRERGYTDISFTGNAPGDICGRAHPHAHHFTAIARNGERIEGLYCGSRQMTFGFNITHTATDLAVLSPP